MPPDALAKGTVRSQSFKRPLSRKLPAVDEWRLVAGKRLIGVPIPDTQSENLKGVGKGR
jgi:hypothetical protein